MKVPTTDGVSNSASGQFSDDQLLADRDSALALADETFAEISKHVELHRLPAYTALEEQAKGLVTIASSALVLSVSVAQFTVGNLHDVKAPILLPAGWILFTLCVLLGMLRFYFFAPLLSMPAEWDVARVSLRDRISNMTDAERTVAAVGRELRRAAEPLGDAHITRLRPGRWLTNAMFLCFSGGLVAVLVFALMNLRGSQTAPSASSATSGAVPSHPSTAPARNDLPRPEGKGRERR